MGPQGHDYALVRLAFAGDPVPPQHVEQCIAALRPPGAIEAAIAYYRGMVRATVSGSAPRAVRIPGPVMVLWG